MSLTHVIPLPWEGQKFLVGFDAVNLLDQKYFYQSGRGEHRFGRVACRDAEVVLFRGQWFF